jgi:hypothetical protein
MPHSLTDISDVSAVFIVTVELPEEGGRVLVIQSWPRLTPRRTTEFVKYLFEGHICVYTHQKEGVIELTRRMVFTNNTLH